MARLTAQEKRELAQRENDRLVMDLLAEHVKSVRIELGIEHARDKAKAREESHLVGWHDGYHHALKEFKQLSWFGRLVWRAER